MQYTGDARDAAAVAAAISCSSGGKLSSSAGGGGGRGGGSLYLAARQDLTDPTSRLLATGHFERNLAGPRGTRGGWYTGRYSGTLDKYGVRFLAF